MLPHDVRDINQEVEAMNKHTPGPWRVGRNRLGSPNIYGRSNSKPICFLWMGDDDSESYSECVNAAANGPVLAAAPDLLEACELLVLALGTMPARSRASIAGYDKAVKAIKKARGK